MIDFLLFKWVQHLTPPSPQEVAPNKKDNKMFEEEGRVGEGEKQSGLFL